MARVRALGTRFCSVLATLAFTGLSLAGEAVELKPKFPSGRTRYLQLDRDVSQKMKGPMGNMEMDMKMVEGIVERVESGSAEGSKVSMTYDRMSFAMDNPMMGELNYDSDMPSADDTPQLKEYMSLMVGESFTLEFDKDGKAKSASGMKKILDKISKKVSQNMFFEHSKEEMTDAAVKIQHGNLFDVLPSKKVSAGDKWKAETVEEMPNMGKIKVEYECKLDRITEEAGRKVGVITYTAKLTQLEMPKTGMMGPMKVESGTSKGTLSFAINEGEVARHEHETNMKMSSKAPAPGGGEDEEGGKKEDEKKPEGPSMSFDMTVKEIMSYKTPAEREKEKKENAEKAKKKAAEEEDEDDDE